ncbi:DHA2 family efflux MFS transporter permease subunit [Sporolactobacillus spathodeae]|uniref:EmrB/QacA subfamily drug resistance transporter n=1 Tax=Sporolactobacillus spathodeae TaxID=1465502 RepID=A0ABS2Q4M3_9BACL|nr:DHA2 family efflux MFS transporter permease subunit [Sporolactobacillus spathodeae]MBM7656723.1 EmrB/QacA subfamily drug resistance transporter [Sporolactobacillus spathodeae]
MTPFLSIYGGCALVALVLFNWLLLHRRWRRKAGLTDSQARAKRAFKTISRRETPEETTIRSQRMQKLSETTIEPNRRTSPEKAAMAPTGANVTSPKINLLSVMLVLLLGAFIALLNQTLMNVALPKMMTAFNISTSTAQWITTGYMLVNGVLIPVTAFLMETFTTRRLFLSAMGLFTAGTLICAIAPGFTFLMIGRVVQASGAGIIMPLMTNVFLTVFPPEKRGGAMGMMGLAMIFAPAIGPTLSGYIVEHFTWRLLFWVVFPLGLIDIALAYRYLANVGKRTFPKLDVLGLILSTTGFGGLLYAFSEAGNKGWDSLSVKLTLIIGIISLILFVWRELVIENPILDLKVFRYKIFTLTTIINIFITMAMFAAMILLPIYLQNIRSFTPLQSGLLLLPGALLMGVMSPITGILFDRIGSRPLAIIGLLITVLTTWQFALLTDATSFGHIMFLYTARMFGMSLLMMPIMTEGLNNLPRTLNSHGTAMSNTMRQVAGSLGTAFLVTVMTNRTTYHMSEFANHVTLSNTPLDHQVGMASFALANSQHLSISAGQGLMRQLLNGKMGQLATIQGINDAFVVATGLTIVALILSFFIKRSTPSKKKQTIH